MRSEENDEAARKRFKEIENYLSDKQNVDLY